MTHLLARKNSLARLRGAEQAASASLLKFKEVEKVDRGAVLAKPFLPPEACLGQTASIMAIY
jgi:hypothetical protein